MNAEELAVNLDAASSDMEYNYVVSDWKLLSDAATMLRQQQAEIEELKAKLGCDPAYFDMPARKLTDEEIKQVWSGIKWNGSDPIELTFAREILRKAQSSCNGFCGEYECKENQTVCKRKEKEK